MRGDAIASLVVLYEELCRTVVNVGIVSSRSEAPSRPDALPEALASPARVAVERLLRVRGRFSRTPRRVVHQLQLQRFASDVRRRPGPRALQLPDAYSRRPAWEAWEAPAPKAIVRRAALPRSHHQRPTRSANHRSGDATLPPKPRVLQRSAPWQAVDSVSRWCVAAHASPSTFHRQRNGRPSVDSLGTDEGDWLQFAMLRNRQQRHLQLG